MAKSVKLRTPVPSLEQLGKSLGISKKQQRSLIKIVSGDARTSRIAPERQRKGTAGTVVSQKVHTVSGEGHEKVKSAAAKR